MQSSATPPRLPLAWAENGPRNTVPVPSQVTVTPGAASWTDGFPPLTMTPARAGGIPPFGQDFNGALHGISAWTVWGCAGGPVTFDAAFASAVGGYPRGAQLASTTITGLSWLSAVDGNLTNPDAGGAGWFALFAPRMEMRVFGQRGSLIIPAGVARVKLRLYGGGGPGGNGAGGGGGGGSAGGYYEAYFPTHPGDSLDMQPGAGGIPGGAQAPALGGITQILLNGQVIASATGGGAGDPGPTGAGNTQFGMGQGDPAVGFLPYGQSGQNGASTSSLNYGGAGGGVFGFYGGAAQVLAVAANANANGNGGQIGCGGGGGVGYGNGGVGGGGLIVVEF